MPAGYEHGQEAELPLLIYLNGAGSRGTDNVKQLANPRPSLALIDDPDPPLHHRRAPASHQRQVG